VYWPKGVSLKGKGARAGCGFQRPPIIFNGFQRGDNGTKHVQAPYGIEGTRECIAFWVLIRWRRKSPATPSSTIRNLPSLFASDADGGLWLGQFFTIALSLIAAPESRWLWDSGVPHGDSNPFCRLVCESRDNTGLLDCFVQNRRTGILEAPWQPNESVAGPSC
jgi:hypothetical protein